MRWSSALVVASAIAGTASMSVLPPIVGAQGAPYWVTVPVIVALVVLSWFMPDGRPGGDA